MSISKTLILAGKTITVRELTVQEIYDLSQPEDKINQVNTLAVLLTTATSATREDIMPLAPSQLQPLIDLLMEVNSPFLGQMRAVKMEDAANALERILGSISALPFLH